MAKIAEIEVGAAAHEFLGKLRDLRRRWRSLFEMLRRRPRVGSRLFWL